MDTLFAADHPLGFTALRQRGRLGRGRRFVNDLSYSSSKSAAPLQEGNWSGKGGGQAVVGGLRRQDRLGHMPWSGTSQNTWKHEAMKYDFFIVHVLALPLFSNVVTAAENQGITRNILNQTTFISSDFCTVYFNTGSLKTCQTLKWLGDQGHQILIFRVNMLHLKELP